METDMQTFTISPPPKVTNFSFPKDAQRSETYAKQIPILFCIHKFQMILRIKENPKKIVFRKKMQSFFSFS